MTYPKIVKNDWPPNAPSNVPLAQVLNADGTLNLPADTGLSNPSCLKTKTDAFRGRRFLFTEED